ncbi:MAG: hypothetical protein N2112_02460 [Gemmataceae bacterium]|nr:hypothetical protein [Gemmataceae bacterium]
MTLAVKWAEIGPSKIGPTSVSYTTHVNGSSTRERLIKVNYNDLDKAIEQCLGYSYLETTSGVPYRLRRELPEFFPFDLDSSDQSYTCKTVNVYQFGKWLGRKEFIAGTFGALDTTPNADTIGDTKQKLNWYNTAFLRLTYESTNYNSYKTDTAMVDAGYTQNESKRFCSFRYTQSAKYFSVPGLTFHVVTGAIPPPALTYPVGLIESKGTLTVTWHCVAWEAVPINTIRSAIGKVNSQSWNFFGKTYAPGTLLCMAPQYNSYTMANGKLGCDVVFTFEEFLKEHNRILYRVGGALDYYWLVTDSTISTPPVYGSLPVGKTLFGEMNFDDLFNVSLG